MFCFFFLLTTSKQLGLVGIDLWTLGNTHVAHSANTQLVTVQATHTLLLHYVSWVSFFIPLNNTVSSSYTIKLCKYYFIKSFYIREKIIKNYCLLLISTHSACLLAWKTYAWTTSWWLMVAVDGRLTTKAAGNGTEMGPYDDATGKRTDTCDF